MPKLWITLLAALALSGCTSSKVVRGPVNVTVGQQLIDLKKAHTAGVLSAREYDEQRRSLIRSVK